MFQLIRGTAAKEVADFLAVFEERDEAGKEALADEVTAIKSRIPQYHQSLFR